MHDKGPGAADSKRRSAHFIGPTPGPDPFRELVQRMGDGACGTKTYRIVAAALLYLATVKPGGGRIPHTTIARVCGSHHTDVRQVLDRWAGVLFNQMLKGVDAQGRPSAASYRVDPRPPGHESSDEVRQASPGVGPVPLGGCGQDAGSSTSRPHGRGAPSGDKETLSGEDFSAIRAPGHSGPAYTSYNHHYHPPSTSGCAAEFGALFAGDQISLGMDLPSGRPFRSVTYTAPGKLLRTLGWHLEGRARVHLYPIRTHPPYQGCVKLGVFDLDGDDRLADAERLLAALASRGTTAYLERSLSGGFHLWFFLSAWAHAGTVHRWMKSILRAEGIRAEVRPSNAEIPSGSHPGQMAIALPFFGDGGSCGDTCRIVDPYLLSPVPLGTFLEKVELNDPNVLSKSRSTTSSPPYFSVPSLSIPFSDLESLVNSWPPIRKGESHTARNGKVKGGRNDAAVAHVGELAARGLRREEILPYLERWNATCIPPLSDSELRRCTAWLRRG